MKIEMYKSKKRKTNGYKLIAETEEEKLILGDFRNDAFFTDGLFRYEGYESNEQDDKDNLVSEVEIAHNRPSNPKKAMKNMLNLLKEVEPRLL